MRTRLQGTERLTLELEGTLPEHARALVPAPLEVPPGPVRVSLLLLAMQGLRMRGVVWPRFDYREALWRIDARYAGEPAWFAVACDLDHAAVRALGRRLIRYPTRSARITEAWTVDAAGGTFACEVATVASEPSPLPPRRTFVADGALYEVPWAEVPAPSRHHARVVVQTDTLSAVTVGDPVSWARDGIVHAGRIHRCGLASRIE